MKTKRVRILVAIDDTGRWTSHGSYYEDDEVCREWICIEEMNTCISYHWIEADIPWPSAATITGNVSTEGKPDA